ncbi:aminotransferase class V-fold PLP-dependent enzyme [Nitriliruptor alkaliphilus]|uniref:aminotransferase class V-fold PLP-dependent enzyme n=1 Tax=Nitriliruptor alkaliphilus TaxID=427918 RepID=UPI0009F901EB|nr:aminotransferase class V-fold PLP-dependent enzyme [Nitriliruptor alkaliphilus]
MGIDVVAERAATPGCAGVLHLDHAGASLPPRVVTETIIAQLRREEELGGYAAADAVADRRGQVRTSLARLLGVTAEEVAIVENASRAWQLTVGALARRWRPAGRLLTWRTEYGSNVMEALALAGRRDVEVAVLPDDAQGRVDLDALDDALDDRVAMIALTHAPSIDGVVQPAAEVGRRARAAGVPFVLDVCQSVGQLDVTLPGTGADVLVGTGRKFLRGPRGTGFLAVRGELLATLDAPFAELGSSRWAPTGEVTPFPDARRFETWERSVALELGLGAAVDHLLSLGPAAVEAHVTAVAEDLRRRLAELPRITVRDTGPPRSAIVTFTVDGVDAAELVAQLRSERIHLSAMDASAARWALGARGLPAVLRASVHTTTTEEELDRFVARLASW